MGNNRIETNRGAFKKLFILATLALLWALVAPGTARSEVDDAPSAISAPIPLSQTLRQANASPGQDIIDVEGRKRPQADLPDGDAYASLQLHESPVSGDDDYVMLQDTELSIAAPGVLGNDVDPDGDELTAVLEDSPQHGSIDFNSDGSFVYTPDRRFIGTDSFNYHARDASGRESISGLMTIEVVADGNESPVSADDDYVMLQDTDLSIEAPGVLGNDVDPDGDELTAVLEDSPQHGSIDFHSDGSFVYTPDRRFIGTDSFNYHTRDASGRESISGLMTIEVVADGNESPVSADDDYVMLQDTLLSIEAPGVLGNDVDVDGDQMTAVLEDSPQHGSIDFNGDGSFTYTPDSGFIGTDSFNYHTRDDAGRESGSGLMTIVIAANVSGSPVSGDDDYITLQDTVLSIEAPGVLGNDVDPDGGTLVAVLEDSPQHGSIDFNGDGSFVYTPDRRFIGVDSFNYYARDASGRESISGLMTIEVVADGNESPVSADDDYVMLQDTELSIAAPGVLGNDVDPEGDSMTAVLEDSPQHGSIDFNGDGSFVYTPDNRFIGTDSFNYHTRDDAGRESGSGLMTIEIVADGNESPVAGDDDYVMLQDRVLSIAAPGVLGNDVDPDRDELSAVLEDSPQHGSINFNGDGSFVYTPESGFIGTDSFNYHTRDESGRESGSGLMTIEVLEDVNESPVAADDEYVTLQDTVLTLVAPGVLDNDVDPDGDPLTAVLEDNPQHGSIDFNGDGSFVYTPDGGFSGTDSFNYHARDSSGNESSSGVVTIEVQFVNQPPVVFDDAYAMLQDTVLTLPAPGVLDNDEDADGDNLVAELVSAPGHGQVALNDDGSFSYVPDSGYVGLDSFTYRARDGYDESNNVATASITVEESGVNVAPTALGDSYEASANTTLEVSAPGVLGNDADANGDELTAVLVSDAQHGQLALNADGGFSYTPDGGYAGDDSFIYRAYDGTSHSNEVVVRIGVQAEEVAPGNLFLPLFVR